MFTKDNLLSTFRYEGLELEMYYTGGQYVGYIFRNQNGLLASGTDYKPSPLHNVDSTESLCALLGFLTCKPGDTDPEYFKNHTPEHLQWLESDQREEINLFLYDLEADDPVLKECSKKFFNDHTHQ